MNPSELDPDRLATPCRTPTSRPAGHPVTSGPFTATGVTAPVGAFAYQSRAAEETVLHRLVREHLEPFLTEIATRIDGGALPRFVEREFREFLTCGMLARGFARVRCGDCAFERLVPFSCKRRGFCPSCGGRRMKHAS